MPRRRTLLYLAMAAGLAVGSVPLREVQWIGTSDLHTLLETIATLVAFMVGVLALVRYYSKKDNTFLLIGSAFVGTAFLDGYHAVVTSPWFAEAFPSPLMTLVPWSWLTSRLFLSLMLWFSWLAWTRETRLGKAGLISERRVYLGIGALTLASFFFFAFVPTPPAYVPSQDFSRPQELLPAAFFLMALVGYLRKGEWKHSAYEHWLILSLLLGTMGQAFVMPTSQRLFDAPFVANHLLKLLSYLCVLIGLTANAYQLFRRAETSTKEAEQATEALRETHDQLEVRVRQRTEELQCLNEALQESEARFRMMADSAPVMIWMSDTDQRCIYLNQVWLQFTGRPLEQDLGHGWVEHVHPDDRERCIGTYVTAFDARQGFAMDYRLRRHDGEYRWVLDKGTPRFNRDGSFAGYVGSCVDITERKRAEDALRENEARLLQQLTALVALTGSEALRASDLKAALQHVTETDARTLGVERVSVWRYNRDRTAIHCIELYEISKNRHSSGVQLDAVAYPSYFRALNETNVIAADDARRDPRTCEFLETYLNPLGITSMMDTPIHVNGVLGGVLCHEQVGPMRQWTLDEKTMAIALANVVSLVIEQCERKRAEDALRESENRFRTAFEETAVGMALVAPDGRYLRLNRAFCALLGYAEEELLAKTFLHITHPDDRVGNLRAVDQLLAGKIQYIHLEKRYLHKLGQEIWMLISASLVRDAQGYPQYFISQVQDITHRKQAEEALRQSEERFRQVTEHIQEVFWLSDPEKNRILYISSAYEDIWGRTCESLYTSPRSWLEAVYPSDRERVLQAALTKQVTGAYDEEYRIQRPDGSVRWIRDRAFPIRDGAGQVYRIAGIAEDITELKRAEEALTMQSRVLESMAEGVSLSDEQGFICYTNPAEDAMFGYQRGELIGKHVTVLNIYAPDENARIVGNVIEQLTTQGNWSGEFSNRKKDSTPFTTFARITALEISNKKYWVCVQEDITGRKQAEAALRESEELFRNAFQETAVGMALTNLDGRLQRANRFFCEMLGYTEEELLTKTFVEITHPDDRNKNLQDVKRLLAGEVSAFHIEKRYLHKLGGDVWAHLSVSLVRDTLGRPLYYIALAQDITARKRAEEELRKAEEQLRQAQKMEAVGRLAGGIAHDFNNLLTIITGYSDILLSRLGPDASLRRYPEQIKKAGDHAATLTRQLLAFSRKQVLHAKVLNLNELVASAETLLRRLIGEHIELRTALQPALRNVKADPGQLEQVVLNLAVNARDAMPQGGRLTISTASVEVVDQTTRRFPSVLRPGPYVTLAVSDTGYGMDEDTQGHIFEPFFTTKEPGKGTGLGLATVYGIIKQSGGFIFVQSQPSRGTTFTIYLPAAEGERDRSESEPDPSNLGLPPGTETILLVEDEPEVRAFVGETLRHCGYTVLEAQHGSDALSMAERHPTINLLITDVVMPQMGGGELADRLIRIRPDLKVLFISGYTGDAIIRHGVNAEGSSLLQKPFSQQSLAFKVRETLNSH